MGDAGGSSGGVIAIAFIAFFFVGTALLYFVFGVRSEWLPVAVGAAGLLLGFYAVVRSRD